MTGAKDKNDWVDALLDDVGRAPVPGPDPTLMARVLADAEAAQPAPGGHAGGSAGLWGQILAGFGGWLSVGGLVAATAVGFAVGLGALGATGFDAYMMGGFGVEYDDSFGLGVHGWDIGDG